MAKRFISPKGCLWQKRFNYLENPRDLEEAAKLRLNLFFAQYYGIHNIHLFSGMAASL